MICEALTMRKAEVEEVVMGLGLRSLECEVKVASDLENLGESRLPWHVDHPKSVSCWISGQIDPKTGEKNYVNPFEERFGLRFFFGKNADWTVDFWEVWKDILDV